MMALCQPAQSLAGCRSCYTPEFSLLCVPGQSPSANYCFFEVCFAHEGFAFSLATPRARFLAPLGAMPFEGCLKSEEDSNILALQLVQSHPLPLLPFDLAHWAPGPVVDMVVQVPLHKSVHGPPICSWR